MAAPLLAGETMDSCQGFIRGLLCLALAIAPGCSAPWIHRAHPSGTLAVETSEPDPAHEESAAEKSVPAEEFSKSEPPREQPQAAKEPEQHSTEAPTPPQKTAKPEHSLRKASELLEELKASGALDEAAAGQLRHELDQLLPPNEESAPKGTTITLREERSSEPAPRTAARNVPRETTSDEWSESELAPRPEPRTQAPRGKSPKAREAELDAPPVSPASCQTPVTANPPLDSATGDSLSWHEHLRVAIAGLEQETQDAPDSSAAVARHAGLRMLYLIEGRKGDAVQSISGISAAQQDFWTEALYGLSTVLDAEQNPDQSRRATEAATHLRLASAKLAELANLNVRNMSLCKEVQGWGHYKICEKYEFRPGQPLLIYAELENFRSESTDDGYKIAVKGSYQILDGSGKRIASEEFPVSEDQCSNPRRDLYVMYNVSLPTKLAAGHYTLQLTIEDTLSQKLGNSSLSFTVSH